MKNRPGFPLAERGVATLAISMLLLFAMSLVALFANRGLIFEQRSSANQYRATRAFETAEAGLEWATAMLNDPRAIGANCLPGGSATSFRARYVATGTPACRLSDSTLVCSCPEAGAYPDLSGGNEPSFSLNFAPVAGDAESIQVTAMGCTSPSADCVPGASGGPADAKAQLSVTLKLRPLLRILPGAALTVGGAVRLEGSATLRNSYRVSSGVLVEAGGDIEAGSDTRLMSLPGSPGVSALVANEPSLDRLLREAVDGNGVFNAFFGMPLDRYRKVGPVQAIAGGTAASRADALIAARDRGFDAFHVDGGVDFNAPRIGSFDRPVLIVSSGPIGCSQPCVIHGLVYNDVASRDAGSGTHLAVQGAVITRGDHRQSSGESVTYAASALNTLRQRAAIYVRVPGSWHEY